MTFLRHLVHRALREYREFQAHQESQVHQAHQVLREFLVLQELQVHRVYPEAVEYSPLAVPNPDADEFVKHMEEIDDLSLLFSSLPTFRATAEARKFLSDFLSSDRCSYIMNA